MKRKVGRLAPATVRYAAGYLGRFSRHSAARMLAPSLPVVLPARRSHQIDTIVLPLLFVSTLMCGTDKVILGTAATFGLQTDLGLKGQEYSWATSIRESPLSPALDVTGAERVP